MRLTVGPHRTTEPGQLNLEPVKCPSLNSERASMPNTRPISLTALRFHVAAMAGARGNRVIWPSPGR